MNDLMDIYKQQLFAFEDDVAAEAEAVSTDLWNHPELSEEEFRSAALLTEKAREHGFEVTEQYAGIPTAFLASYGDAEGPTAAFLAEYDALPGYGEMSPDGSGSAHACGHNWIAASTFAAACALKEFIRARKKEDPSFRGRVLLIGTPAEETYGGKIKMADAGAFDGIDAAFQCHLWNGTQHCVRNCALATTDITYTFHGKKSHASLHPETGINALDALTLMYNGVSMLRQHVLSDVRIHGIVKEGGTACNVVPERTQAMYYVRSAHLDYLEEVIERVNNCARGAALQTGCTVDIDRDPYTFADLRNTEPLLECVKNNMKRWFGLGDEDFREDSIYHAASTDIGNVSYHAPTFYGEIGMGAVTGAAPHDIEFLKYTDSDYARKMLHFAAKSMGAAAVEVLCDAGFRAEMWEAFRKLG